MSGKPGEAFTAQAVEGGRLKLELRGTPGRASREFMVEQAGGIAVVVLRAAHQATVANGTPQKVPLGLTPDPPVPVWATAVERTSKGSIHLRIAVGGTDLGFLLNAETAARLAQALGEATTEVAPS